MVPVFLRSVEEARIHSVLLSAAPKRQRHIGVIIYDATRHDSYENAKRQMKALLEANGAVDKKFRPTPKCDAICLVSIKSKQPKDNVVPPSVAKAR